MIGILVALWYAEVIGRSLIMKKTLVFLTAAICLLAAFAYASDKSATETNQAAILKTTNVKATKMNARGKVVEISDKAIKIERSIKGNMETMEFVMENQVMDIAVNDSVKIDYSVKDGKLTASRVVKPAPVKNTGKNGTKKTGEKPASTPK